MHRRPAASFAAMLCLMAMSAVSIAGELSGDRIATDSGALVIRQFRPKIVYPYHYRSHDGTKADFGQLKRLVGDDSGVEIRVREWYPER
jgi:L-ascorbate metabolism protein UlaG (beta-lactamase superfamily)